MYDDAGCGRKGCEACDEEVIAFLALQNPEAAAGLQYGANELACDEDGNLLAMMAGSGGGGGGGGGGGRAKSRRPPNFIIAGGGSTPQMYR